MSAPASSSSSAPSSSHVSIRFFDSQPRSITNLLQSSDVSWQTKGRSQLARAVGVEDAHQQLQELNPASIKPTSKGWLPTPSAEQAEIEEFVRWVREDAKALVRQIVEVLPVAVYEQVANKIAEAELHDFSPKGRVDDEIFEKNRDVWERITRGCAVLKIVSQKGQTIWRWAVRANKKFTGHEDEAAVADSKLYCIAGDPADSVVVSHKCNGSVLHLAARDVEVDGESMRWVFLGSKKVHVGAVWNSERGVKDWIEKMKVFHAERHEYVSEMVQFIEPHLTEAKTADLILTSLATFRLTLNAEYVSSIGTGPTDNEQIYGLSADGREAFAFMLTFNALTPGAGCELGLDMLFGLYLLTKWGFHTVSAFEVSIKELPEMKAAVTTLPDVEGAVLYSSNASGVIQLEKWKSSGYVVLRAIREKLKPFIFGGRDRPGLAQMVEKIEADTKQGHEWICKKTQLTQEQLEQALRDAAKAAKKKLQKQRKKKNATATTAAASSISVGELKEALSEGEDSAEEGEAANSLASLSSPAVVPLNVVNSPDMYLEYSHPLVDSVGVALMAEGGSRVSEGTWRVPCPAAQADEVARKERIDQAFRIALLEKPVADAIARVGTKIVERIKSIDHIPMTDEERNAWMSDSTLFLQWLKQQILVNKRWQPKQVMNMYSKLWTLFKADQQAK